MMCDASAWNSVWDRKILCLYAPARNPAGTKSCLWCWFAVVSGGPDGGFQAS
jgi:hypothetical protein